MSYEMLLSPMKIGTMTVKNRTVMTAAEFSLGQTDGTPTEKLMDYYEERIPLPAFCRRQGAYDRIPLCQDDILEARAWQIKDVFKENRQIMLEITSTYGMM